MPSPVMRLVPYPHGIMTEGDGTAFHFDLKIGGVNTLEEAWVHASLLIVIPEHQDDLLAVDSLTISGRIAE
jgi:hypothetical protein